MTGFQQESQSQHSELAIEQLSVIEQDFAQLIERIDQALTNSELSSQTQTELRTLAQAVFAHNPTSDWLEKSQSDLLRCLQRIFEFTAHFDGRQKAVVMPAEGNQHRKQSQTVFAQAQQRLDLPITEEHSATDIILMTPDMPFLVDSVRMLMNREHYTVLRQLSAVVVTERQDGRLISLRAASQADTNAGLALEATMYLQLRESLDEIQIASLEDSLVKVMQEVRSSIEDHSSMLALCASLATEYEQNIGRAVQEPVVAKREGMPAAETAAFLHWLADNHFVFLGARQYVYEQGQLSIDSTKVDLGWLTADASVDLQEDVPLTLFGEQPLYFAKSATFGRTHRSAYPDILRVVRHNQQGEPWAEVRFIGFYTSSVYRTSVRSIPIVRRLADNIAQQSHFLMGGHDGKSLWQLMETYPRDEWLQSSFDQLSDVFMRVISLQERPLLRLIVRVDAAYRFVSVMIFVPKERYNTQLRIQFERILEKHLPVIGLNFDVFFSESVLARVHMTVRVNAARRFQIDAEQLQRLFLQAALTWNERLIQALRVDTPFEVQSFLEKEFVEYFPSAYQVATSATEAAQDILGLHNIALHRQVHIALRESQEHDGGYEIKLYGRGELPTYSRMIPILEHIGFYISAARSHRLTTASGIHYSITTYNVQVEGVEQLDMATLQPHLEDSIDRVLSGFGSSDQFNRLLLVCGFSVAQVRLYRAYARYMRQIGFGLSYRYMAQILCQHSEVTQMIFAMFETKFLPGKASLLDRQKSCQSLQVNILEKLERVSHVDDDRILRQYLELVGATVRTNYYKISPDPQDNPFLALKLKPSDIRAVPKPVPYFEIFVYSSEVEGVHLRGGPVARGGLRWSDRPEDYRTEVLGLVKAQQVKNAVIVPVGAKGGFVCKRVPKDLSRAEYLAAGQRSYRVFIRGLLSVTDNLVQGEIVPPENVVRFDGDDPYLVVAADKGTASFSDIANSIAQEHDFWLGDGFASGGSQGYDHKKMGITARGAWVSVQRHFQALDRDVQTDPTTVVGIGDMAGDVFGNGMLLSKSLELVAAFNHLHIFLDPNPNALAAFQERTRMFALPQSSWDDYKKSLISTGGGVYARSLKSIQITPEVSARFNIKESVLTPTELIHRLLQAQVDLIWNGGIGTYVKASFEEHQKVGDKANDLLRINGMQLRCRVFGEGGNLGITQLGRIEAANKGVKLNTDFIDNAGGVDCSDHEVNLKILFASLMQQQRLTLPERNQMLETMTEAVADMVLDNNADQVRALSLAERDCVRRMGEYRRLTSRLEANGSLDRALEFIPDDEALQELAVSEKGLSRPELAVLMCYTKAELKVELANCPLSSTEYALAEAYRAFPPRMVAEFRADIDQHRLINAIAATQMANSIVHRVGITVVQRMLDTSGATIEQTVAVYLVIKQLLAVDQLWDEIETLGALPYLVQMDLFATLQRLIRRSMRLLLRNTHQSIDVKGLIIRYQNGITLFFENIEQILQSEDLQQWQQTYQRFTQAGVPEPLARHLAACDYGLTAFDVVDVLPEPNSNQLFGTAQLFFRIRHQLGCAWLEDQIREFDVSDHWTAKAREAFLDELYTSQRRLIAALIEAGERHLELKFAAAEQVQPQVISLCEHFGFAMKQWILRWSRTIQSIQQGKQLTYPAATVALQEFQKLVDATAQWALDDQRFDSIPSSSSGV